MAGLRHVNSSRLPIPCSRSGKISSSANVYAPRPIRIAAKGAQLAVRDADVRGIDVADLH